MITTIIFDLAEVYLRGVKGVEKYIQNRYGIEIQDKALSIPELKNLFHGEITEEKYWQTVLKTYHWKISIKQLKNAVRSNFKEIKGTREIIEKLKQNGYKLGLLSVHAKEWIEFTEKNFNYHKLFHSVMYSFEVSVSKPEKKAYDLILNRLNVKPEECLFIDDSLENIIAAKKLRIASIQFKSPKQLLNDLHKLNINLN